MGALYRLLIGVPALNRCYWKMILVLRSRTLDTSKTKGRIAKSLSKESPSELEAEESFVIIRNKISLRLSSTEKKKRKASKRFCKQRINTSWNGLSHVAKANIEMSIVKTKFRKNSCDSSYVLLSHSIQQSTPTRCCLFLSHDFIQWPTQRLYFRSLLRFFGWLGAIFSYEESR